LEPNGIIALQAAGNHALLRSFVVAEKMRGRGLGKALVLAVENLARKRNISQLYLLTETAETFFKSLGYETISRDQAPQAITQTSEFSGLCPDDAALMVKR